MTGLVGFVLGRPAKEKRHCYGKIHIHLVGWIRVCRISCIKLTIWEFIANNIKLFLKITCSIVIKSGRESFFYNITMERGMVVTVLYDIAINPPIIAH